MQQAYAHCMSTEIFYGAPAALLALALVVGQAYTKKKCMYRLIAVGFIISVIAHDIGQNVAFHKEKLTWPFN